MAPPDGLEGTPPHSEDPLAWYAGAEIGGSFTRLAKMEQIGEMLPQTGQSGQTTATSKVDQCSETSWFGRRGEISMPSRH